MLTENWKLVTGNWKLETQTGKSPISIEFPMAEGFAVNTRRVFYEVCIQVHLI